jgi:hypothetical protein
VTSLHLIHILFTLAHLLCIPFYQEFGAVVVPLLSFTCIEVKSSFSRRICGRCSKNDCIPSSEFVVFSPTGPLSLLNFFAKTHPSSHVDHVLSKVVVCYCITPFSCSPDSLTFPLLLILFMGMDALIAISQRSERDSCFSLKTLFFHIFSPV